MDSGEAFNKKFPGVDALNDLNELKKVLNQIDDVSLLGSLIFSKWRFITHWSETSLLSKETKSWFLLAFTKLIDLTLMTN